ncbi:MAG: hypothetical protein ACFFD4_24635 [Candidatus Odinarchaeota archaeon]
MNSNQSRVKLTGKEQAKVNKRIMFYKKFERICKNIIEQGNEGESEIIPLSLNKKVSFPEYDDLSLLFKEYSSEVEDENEIDVTNNRPLVLPFLDDARFLVNASKDNLVKIIRQETDKDDDGSMRRGVSAVDDDTYAYQVAYYWGIQLLDPAKLLELVEKEIEEPTTYVVEVVTKKVPKPKSYRKPYRKYRGPPRRGPPRSSGKRKH